MDLEKGRMSDNVEIAERSMDKRWGAVQTLRNFSTGAVTGIFPEDIVDKCQNVLAGYFMSQARPDQFPQPTLANAKDPDKACVSLVEDFRKSAEAQNLKVSFGTQLDIENIRPQSAWGAIGIKAIMQAGVPRGP